MHPKVRLFFLQGALRENLRFQLGNRIGRISFLAELVRLQVGNSFLNADLSSHAFQSISTFCLRSVTSVSSPARARDRAASCSANLRRTNSAEIAFAVSAAVLGSVLVTVIPIKEVSRSCLILIERCPSP